MRYDAGMIVLAITHPNLSAGSYEWGVADFARKKRTERWERVVVLPQPFYRAGVLRKHKVRGLIAFLSSPELEADARSLGVPVVNLSARPAHPRLPTVTVDGAGVGVLAGKYFLEKGYRHFAYVSDPLAADYALERGRGFVESLQGIATSLAWFGPAPDGLSVDLTRSGSLAAWLTRLPKPVAIFAAQDRFAAEVQIAAGVARLHVPRQVSILGVDNDPTLRDVAGGISSIVLPRRRVGYEAAAMLDRLMDGRPLRDLTVRVPATEIITRASSDARAIDDAIVLEALRRIDELAPTGADVSDIIRPLPLSRRAVERRFYKVTGETLKAQIQRTRVAQALRLLTATAMPVDEIAIACGFNDRNRFFVTFKDATGEAPSAYRARHRDGGAARAHF